MRNIIFFSVLYLFIFTSYGGDDDNGPQDSDGDGYSVNDDCNDSDATVNPGAREIPYNGIDDDCDPLTLDDDLDGDTYNNDEDCDDTDANVNPEATEVCGDGIDNNCNGNVDEGCAIGDLIEGGVVFYIAPTPTDLDGDGTLDIGLVCALSDAPFEVEWGCAGTDLPNVQNGDNPDLGAEIGDGMSNTNGIINDCPTASAALAARNDGPEWFLPSIKELNQMFINKTTLEAAAGFDAFQSWRYWSSTEVFEDAAWGYNSIDGIPESTFGKVNSFFVRAVRAF